MRKAWGVSRYVRGLGPIVVTRAAADSRKRAALAVDKTRQSPMRPVSRSGHVVDGIAGIHGRDGPSRSVRRIGYHRSAGVVKGLQRAVEVVIVAHGFADRTGRTRQGQRFTGEPSENVERVSGTGAANSIADAGEMPNAVRTSLAELP